jgi:hypothetical protein
MPKIFIGLLIFLSVSPLFPQEAVNAPVAKNRIILAPVTSLTDNREFQYLKGTVYNVLLINLKKQERIAVVNEEPGAEAVIAAETGFESYLAALSRAFPGATAVIAEYYVASDKLHIPVNVWDVDTRRTKNSFIETMPADLDLLSNIEKMSSNIAASRAAVEGLIGPPAAAAAGRSVSSGLSETLYVTRIREWILFALPVGALDDALNMQNAYRIQYDIPTDSYLCDNETMLFFIKTALNMGVFININNDLSVFLDLATPSFIAPLNWD